MSTVDDIMDLLGPGVPKTPVRDLETDEERKERIRQHQAHQAARPGLNPGDDISQHQMGREYPHAQWVPIGVAQRFRDHEGDQHHGSGGIVDDLTNQLKSGRGVTDPLMLLHHNEARVAHLGEGNHRLKAMENAGWTHVPMRVVRMYDKESNDYLHKPDKHIPLHWLGSHIGRTPEMAQPSEVFSFGSKQHPEYSGEHEQEGGAGGHQSLAGRGGTLALLRWIASGKSRRRDRRDQQRDQQGSGAGSQGPDAAPVAAREITWHPKAVKDLKGLSNQDQKQVLTRVDEIARDEPNAVGQTHDLRAPLKGWYATKASRGHRIIHQPTDDGGLYIGAVSLHEYEEAERRLGSLLASMQWVPADRED